jgi:hypothetical protein
MERLDEERLGDKRGDKGEGNSLFGCGIIMARTNNK